MSVLALGSQTAGRPRAASYEEHLAAPGAFDRLRVVILLCAVLGACGGDSGDASGSAGTSGSGSADAGSDASTLTENTGPGTYALTTQVTADDDVTSHIVLTDNLGGETLTLENALELPGRALGVGISSEPYLWVGNDGQTGNVARYELIAGSLDVGKAVTFLGERVSALGPYGGQFKFLAPDRAFYYDSANAHLVVWNPQDMTVTGSIDCRELIKEDSTLSFSGAPLLVGSKVVMFAGWYKDSRVPSESAIVITDTANGDATKIVTDTRCGYARDGVLGPDGKIYVATEALGSAAHRLNADNAPAPCLLRFDPDTSKFDPDFYVALNDMVDGASAGTLVAGPDGTAFLRVLDEASADIRADTDPRTLANENAWGWARLTLGDTLAVERLSAPLSQGSVVPLPLGGSNYVGLIASVDTTTLIPISADGPGDAVLTVPGQVLSAAKLLKSED